MGPLFSFFFSSLFTLKHCKHIHASISTKHTSSGCGGENKKPFASGPHKGHELCHKHTRKMICIQVAPDQINVSKAEKPQKMRRENKRKKETKHLFSSSNKSLCIFLASCSIHEQRIKIDSKCCDKKSMKDAFYDVLLHTRNGYLKCLACSRV
jgi:hypothetical protein